MFFAATPSVPQRGVPCAQPHPECPLRPGWPERRFSSSRAAVCCLGGCLLLFWISGQQVTLGRTWTSQDGRYTLQANFVKLEGDAVTLQTPDNQFRTVPLHQLSDADQDLARQLSRALVHSVAIEAVGVGLSPEDALNDAFAKAIIQVVGAEVNAKTLVANDELVQDRVLVFSDGFVQDYKDLGCRQQAGLSYRKILAYVQRRDLRSDAVDTEEDGNARRLYAEAYTKVRRHRIGMWLLQEALESFNADMLDTKLADLGKPEVLPNDLDRVRITCRLTVQLRSDGYARVRQRIETVLAALARSQGHMEVMHRRFPVGHDKYRETVLRLEQRFCSQLERSATHLEDVYTLGTVKTTEPLPSVARANARDQSSTLFFVYVPAGAGDVASTAIKSHWRWFEIDGQPQIPTQGINVVVRYTDQVGNGVIEERFPLGPGVPGLSASATNAKLRTVVVSPLFLYHSSDGYEVKDFPHAHRATLERKITVPLTTLARVHTAKALAVGEEVQRSADFAPTIEATPRGAGNLAEAPPRAVTPFDEKAAKQHQAAWAAYLGVPVELTNSMGMRFVLVPPGEFDMGSTAEEIARLLKEARAKKLPNWYTDRLASEAPKHHVRITKPLYLGQCEVTQAEYDRVMGSNPSKFQGDMSRPVEMVSWDEASAFCRKLSELPQEQTVRAGYRLPTEAEWECACRAGTATSWYGTEDEAVLKEHAWCDPSARGPTHPVRLKTPNAWGLYDMHGNVWEWCHDWWANDYYGRSPLDDPTGATAGSDRVFRGGCWGDYATFCRASLRNGNGPGNRFDNLGFRVVREVPVKERSAESAKIGKQIPGPSAAPATAIAPFDEKTAKQHQAAWAEYLRAPVERTNSIGMRFVLIPPGEFLMGSPHTEQGRRDDELLHRVRINKPFYLGVHEVTQAEYEQVMTTRANRSSFSRRGSLKARVEGLDTSRFPVENVSWEDAQAFCAKLSDRPEERSVGWVYRLPTEAEWEYACRAGTTTPFNIGNSLTGREGNCDGTISYGTPDKGPFLQRTTPVGSYAANAFGLCDMHGNVLEWCQDWYADGYYRSSPLDDPPGPSAGAERVIRDGGWGTAAKDCRAATRCKAEPSFRGEGGLGFRVVTVPPDGRGIADRRLP